MVNVSPTKGIPFTQYKRPHGERSEIWMANRPAAVNVKAQQIIDALFNFEAEVLTTGGIALTIADTFGDYAIEVVPNAPGLVAEAVDRMILKFDIAEALAQRKKNV